MYDEHERDELADELADAFLSAPWTLDRVAEAGAGRLDRWPGWMEALALSTISVFRSPPVNRRWDLAAHIESFLAAHPSWPGEAGPPTIVRLTAPSPLSAWPGRPGPMHAWSVAEIDSVSALADRLQLSYGQLAWLADTRSWERTVPDEKLRNYRYRFVPRRSGVPRVVEAPKARLKEVQRWILHEILDHVPGHAAAQGFIRGRSVLSHARGHTRQPALMRLDLEDFFASVMAGRVFGIFRTLGYSRHVAHVLTGLTTNAIPQAVWREFPRTADPSLVGPRFRLGRQLATPHLPQGAPTSPALANLTAFRLDRRLAGLAATSGLGYSRYADDLAFSGSERLARRRRSFEDLVTEIARDEGFSVNPRKTILTTAAGRQSVCGVVVNVRPNVVRSEYDELKAILHNAAVYGPQNQNRAGLADFKAHLRGRISWVAALNPGRGEKLSRRFSQIDWGAEDTEAGGTG